MSELAAVPLVQPPCAKCGYLADGSVGPVNFCPKCGTDLRGDAAVRAASPLVGAVVAERYKLLTLLGEGGMGAVYKAEHVRMGKALALKLLRGDYARDPSAVKRFADEAQIVSRLSHPHAIAVFDFGEIGVVSGLYLAMEYVPGRDLASVLRAERRLATPRVITIGQQILGALAEAHDAGIVHRDVKPGNVMLTQTRTGEDFTKVLDFGIAKLRDEQGASVTSAGAILGTPSYLAPEQARARDVDGRADLYSVGALLYELLTGRPPFVAPNPLAVVNAHLHDPPPPIRELAPELPEGVAEVIHRALEKRPEDRFPTADAMREALLAAGEPSGPPTPRQPLTPEVTGELRIASRDDFREFEAQLVAIRRSRVAAPVAVAALFLLTAAVAWRWPDVYGLLARGAPRVAAALPASFRPADLYDGAEHEPNDSPAQANPLPIPPGPDGRAARGVARMRGHVGARISETTGDIDVFRVEIPPGAAPATLVAEWSGEGRGEGIRGLDVALTLNRQRDDGSGRSAAPLLANVDRAGAGHAETLTAPVEPGTYFLAVRERHKDDTGPVEKPTDAYVLEVRLADPRPGDEVEPNDRPDSVSHRFVGYAEWSTLASRNPLGEAKVVHAETALGDPDTFAVAPRAAGERPELVVAVPADRLALSAQTWIPDAEDLGPPKAADRLRFEDAGAAGPGRLLFVATGGVSAPSAPVLVQLRARQGEGRYDLLALGPGSASGAAAIELAEALAGEGRSPQALELLEGFAQRLPASAARSDVLLAAARITGLAEQDALRAIPAPAPCTPDAVAERAVAFLVKYPRSRLAQEARLWQARALEEAYWRGGVHAVALRAVAAYRTAAQLEGPGRREAEARVRALDGRRPVREGAVSVCR
ncbi:MAG TPA: serine/threonine-protein kinase [Anaeromyxobacteraceae bacterium]|nr:serine/threonine-protein kinase [Anaeromyxobacteraceae bacterium]